MEIIQCPNCNLIHCEEVTYKEKIIKCECKKDFKVSLIEIKSYSDVLKTYIKRTKILISK